MKLRTSVIATLFALSSLYAFADDGPFFTKNISKTPDWENEFADLKMMRFYVPAQNSSGALLTTGIDYLKEDPLTGETSLLFNRGQAKPLIAAYTDGHVDGVGDLAFIGFGQRDVYVAVSLDDGATWRKMNLSQSGETEINFTATGGSTSKVASTATLATAVTLATLSTTAVTRDDDDDDDERDDDDDDARDDDDDDRDDVSDKDKDDDKKDKHAKKDKDDRDHDDDDDEHHDDGDDDDDDDDDSHHGNGHHDDDDDDHHAGGGSGGGSGGGTDDPVERVYYGDVIAQFSGVAGNKVLIAWLSRACTGGNPAYLLADGATTNPWTGLLYEDAFGVQGTQGSVDYSGEDDPAIAEVGVVPFSCVWSARGTVVSNTDGTTKVIWRKPERLSSGRRDANRLEVGMAEDAGFVVTWQEDPEGTLPGQGEGPGEGWSGATVNHQTDIWYSYIPWTHFDAADVDGDGVADSAATVLASTQKPAVVNRMSIPVRLTDNARCMPGSTLPFCEGMDQNNNGQPDFCATTKDYYDSKGNLKTACVAEDGRVFQGQTGASRARVNLQSYNKPDGSTSAWVVLIYEESKGLGEIDLDGDTKGDEVGKNIRYMSFDMHAPDLVKQGLELNAPTKAWACLTGQPDPNLVYTPECYIDWNASVKLAGQSLISDAVLYDTEIARRGALMSQGVAAVTGSTTKTSAVTIFKQGIINQGGPADIMIRRFVAPSNFDASTMNPFDEKNMACDNWAFADGLNPYYLDGLCLTPTTNLSATTPGECADGTLGTNCGYGLVDPEDQTLFPKVYNWTQTVDNLTDESWENAYDVAKGHRGFLSGDFVMAMFAWSPNWKLNAKGQDVYNLYVRRSFDGGQSWTTTPLAKGGVGTETCEIYRDAAGGLTDPVCQANAIGAFEPARNLSQLTTLKRTVLDPRFSPTGGLLKHASTAFVLEGETIVAQEPYPDDTRDPSKFFVVYEDGDNATVAAGGEAEPMDLLYTRATLWGDQYYTVVNTNGTTGVDWLENKEDTHASEAALTANPAGTFFYSVWSQWQYDAAGEIINSDTTFRRVLFDDGIYK